MKLSSVVGKKDLGNRLTKFVTMFLKLSKPQFPNYYNRSNNFSLNGCYKE